jgi:hypothetical protein
MDQFTRQYLHTRDRSGVGVWDRPLDSRDRFVLVTQSSSGSPLCVTATEILDRLRELDPTQPASAAARTKEEKRAQKILEGHVKAGWKGATGSAPIPTRCAMRSGACTSRRSTRSAAGEHAREARRRLRDDVLRDPTQDDVSWKVITHAAETASGGQSGLTRQSLEALLTEATIALRSVRSYDGDIAQLGLRSERSRRILDKFASLRVAGETVHIPRVATDVLAAAAEAASLLVIGEPGAGKSGALHDRYIRTRDAGLPAILLAADDVNAPSITALQTDLGLEHDFIDVLRNWRNAQPGTIIIDALDSLRSNGTGTTLRREIAMVQQEKLNWRVVASIWTFDLRRGAELQKLLPTSRFASRRRVHGLSSHPHSPPHRRRTGVRQLRRSSHGSDSRIRSIAALGSDSMNCNASATATSVATWVCSSTPALSPKVTTPDANAAGL